jgi:hypothetical protein
LVGTAWKVSLRSRGGLFAGSIALVGFGFDSVIEMSSGLALLGDLAFASRKVARKMLAKKRAALAFPFIRYKLIRVSKRPYKLIAKSEAQERVQSAQ